MSLLPPAADEAAYAAIHRDDAAFAPGLAAIASRHRLAGVPARYPAGSLPVYALDDRVIKLYPPYDRAHHDVERCALAGLDGRLPIPSPRLDGVGELDGWMYLVMERLPGVPASTVWDELTAAARDRFAEAVGHTMAALHGVPLDGFGPLRIDWDAFVAEREVATLAQQRRRQLDPRWLEQIPGFLARHRPTDPRRVVLHTELMREHILVVRGADGLVPTGLVDFEPAMIGAPEYELASVGVFVTAGDPRLLDRLLRAYGADPRDPELPLRAMAWALLHRYSHVGWYLERVPPPPGTHTLEALARAWWALPG
jgi:hygromycin-B 7''-O-kinase